MITTLLGTKVNQSQAFDEQGKRIPVTLIAAGPNWVTKITSMPTYTAIQLGFGATKHITKPQTGHLKKAGLTNKLRFLREFKVADAADLAAGAEIKLEAVLSPGDLISVTGTSKGKGFAGVVKRHGFAGGPRTHGQSDRERAPGSIGQTTTPGRVYRGKRMAGRMGSDRVTVRNLRVISVDPATQMLTVKGVIPGASKGLVIIQKKTT